MMTNAELMLILQEARYGTDCPVSGDFTMAVRDAILAGYRAGLRDAPKHDEQYAERMQTAGIYMARLADEAWSLLDADMDMKCLKLLRAMAGQLPGYRADVDEVHAALAKNPGDGPAVGWQCASGHKFKAPRNRNGGACPECGTGALFCDEQLTVELPDSPERYCSGCGGEVEDVATHKCRVEVLTVARHPWDVAGGPLPREEDA